MTLAWCSDCKTLHAAGAHTRPQPIKSVSIKDLPDVLQKESLEEEAKTLLSSERTHVTTAKVPYPLVQAVNDIVLERGRQETLKSQGRFKHTCADAEMTHGDRLAVLTEEVGEVARAILELGSLANDKHGADLRKELVQVAAVCVAWLEAIDKSSR